jgi:hypothetical protein
MNMLLILDEAPRVAVADASRPELAPAAVSSPFRLRPMRAGERAR